MQRKAKTIGTLILSLSMLTSCSYNPFIADNHETGSPIGAAIGAGIGAGGVAALGGSKFYMGLGGLAGGAIGYYVTTLRYDSGGIIQSGGKVYKIGDLIGIYIPSDKLFEPNSDAFLPQAKSILDSTAVVLARSPTNNILISGSTSGFYRSKWEQKLSEHRAQKVAGYLWSAGINNFKAPGLDLRKLNYVGYGDYFPLANKITNDGIRENSRIQITSYPSDCDLGLDKRHVAVHNIGNMDSDDDIANAPTSRCNTTNSSGDCMDDIV
ncbi:MAG: OmpA family protein [Gammaproteobacteria bacterium]|nr:OmpA family protein [Gammaproteobacteria bacterium]MCW5582346.1 OmpA family protein [Gammaproteobacteria bacterium]